MKPSRKQQRRQRQRMRTGTPGSFEGTTMDVPTWREVARIGALSEFVRQTDDLKWSKRLLLLVLEELHITDEFDRFVGPPESLPARRWPQAVALAIALRHSWRPNDLLVFAKGLGVEYARPTAKHGAR